MATDVAGRLRAEGLGPSPWSNGPGDRYGAHEHGYDKVIVGRARLDRVRADGRPAGPVELAAGDRLELPAGTGHDAVVGPGGVTCLEAHLPAGALGGASPPRRRRVVARGAHQRRSSPDGGGHVGGAEPSAARGASLAVIERSPGRVRGSWVGYRAGITGAEAHQDRVVTWVILPARILVAQRMLINENSARNPSPSANIDIPSLRDRRGPGDPAADAADRRSSCLISIVYLTDRRLTTDLPNELGLMTAHDGSVRTTPGSSDILQRDGRRPYAELGADVGMSGPSAHERVKKLEARGVISGYAAGVDPPPSGSASSPSRGSPRRRAPTASDLTDDFAAIPEIEECHHISGEADYLLKIRARDTNDLERVLRQVQRRRHVFTTETDVVFSSGFERRPFRRR